MSTGIEIKQIGNDVLRNLANEVDSSNKKDGYIDATELSVFTSKATELQTGSYSDEDFAQVMGLFKSSPTETTKRASLSWGEIGKTALNSVGKFFKGMFCDENGFSIKRTAATIGTIALLAGAAPLAAVLGASTGVVSGIALGAKVLGIGLAGYMAIDGGVKIVKGTSNYYDAKTHDEAQQAMTEAMDGGVEMTLSLPAIFGILKANKRGVKLAKNNKKVQTVEPKIEIEQLKDGYAKTEFGSDGKPIKRTTYNKYDNLTGETTYEYNIEGKCIGETTNGIKDWGKITYKEDYIKHTSTTTKVKPDGSKFIREELGANKKYTEYDAQGNLKLEYDFVHDGPSVGSSTTTETVIKNGKKITTVIKRGGNGPDHGKVTSYEKYVDGILETNRTYSYEYDGSKDHFCTKVTETRHFNGGSKKNIQHSYTEFKDPKGAIPYYIDNIYDVWDLQ